MKKSMGMLAGLLVLTLAVGPVLAQGLGKGPCGMGLGPRPSWDRMNIPDLTEEQEAKIRGMRVDFMKEGLPLKNEIGEKRARLRTLMTANKTDEKAINKLIDDISRLRTRMMKKKVAHHQAVRRILTEEQRVYFDSKGFGLGHRGRPGPDGRHGRVGGGRW
ncbi:Spy/CpxP family protein refolding chaperone [candidate division KSB1 bacterium]|nr:Spy/CpxP family protein refolding chaperone [candidate division KSB1 bacterium]